MVGKIIRKYLDEGHKRLTVPDFGTFMRKDSGEVIFVDLLRKDDGVLRELVEDYGHYGEVEAMALIDRFVFEIKHGIEQAGSAPIAGFGTMSIDGKGAYQFDYQPAPKVAKPRYLPGRPNLKPQNHIPSKKVDKWIVLAIVVGVIALLVIAYGLSVSTMPFLQ
jgi:nucleoid DNA-binding protein